ncbi:MAG: GNAT family N-acetyltransferase [Acidobacteriota bacterium]|nr:GNAT family N-acetyltransferase [Acidobacteriota bacterium]
MQRAFGTLLGAPEPDHFMSDRNYIRSRWRADPSTVFAAVADDLLVGSNVATRWGSVAFFGPLTVAPEYWNQGAATQLLARTMALFAMWDTTHAGLFTFPHIPKHVTLYQKFGFWPRYLTAVMSKPTAREDSREVHRCYSDMDEAHRSDVLRACCELTDQIFEGLDITREVRAVQTQALGDTVLVWAGDRLEAFAVCHCGAGTEAGAGACYVKFGAARPGPGVETRFERLLTACMSLARSKRLPRVDAGVSLARERAYQTMRARGFRTQIQGVCMHRPHAQGYHRPDVFAIDDWR